MASPCAFLFSLLRSTPPYPGDEGLDQVAKQ
jgi:hypothetical protein